MKNLCYAFVWFLAAVCYVNAINYEKCGGGKGIMTINKLSLNPDPVKLSGKTLRASMSAELHEELRADTIVDIKIWKVTWKFFGIKIYIKAPCILGSGKCHSEYCSLLRSFNAECVRAKGVYNAEDVTLYLPDIGDVARWFASGHFHIELRFIEKNSHKELGCYIFTGETHALV